MDKKIELIQETGNHIKIVNKNIFYKGPDNRFYCIIEQSDSSRILHVKEASNIIQLHNIKGCFENLKIDDNESILIDNDVLKQQLNKVKLNNDMEFSFYESSLRSIDLTNYTKTIDLIRADSDTYTNTIDLNNLIEQVSVPETKCIIDLNIQYSDINEKIFNKSTFLEGFRFDSNGKLQGDNIVQDLNEVELTYVDGIITVISKTLNINELIINKCTITYGKL